MEGDGFSAAGKWGKAAPGTCPKDPPVSLLLQPLPSTGAGCSVTAAHQQDPNQILHGALGATEKCTFHR